MGSQKSISSQPTVLGIATIEVRRSFVRKRSVKSPVQSVKETELKTFPSKPILSRDPVTRRQAHLSRVHSILFSKSDVRYQRSKKAL
ncbi:uncharacterized protein LOC105735712 isoform X3 [Apis florea]|uniref:uncharacterized protein LOC105735712 isoform X3 n=1 Tax=Apis florea TaxID=7463 RepID=UPI0012FED0E0|nr:uncharacterized protein LOC105735712 isoform X3 [Apis florea]